MTPVCPARDWATNNKQFSPVRREGPSFFGHENFITKDDFEDIYFLFYTFNVLIIGILSNKNRLITRRKCTSIPLVTRRFKSNYHFVIFLVALLMNSQRYRFDSGQISIYQIFGLMIGTHFPNEDGGKQSN